jgi:predicted RNA-binding protein with PUA-like domain
MNYWLMKSEPDEYSWSDLVKEGKTFWSGIRNYAARLNLRAMQVGDQAFFYHSNIGKDIVGVMEIASTAYPDNTATDGKDWVGVDVVPKYALAKSVSLADIKANPKLANMQLIKISRLSVSAVSKTEFEEILRMSKHPS